MNKQDTPYLSDEYLLQRKSPPATSELEARILSATKGMPQDTSTANQYRNSNSIIDRLRQFSRVSFTPRIAVPICALLVVSAVMLGLQNKPQSLPDVVVNETVIEENALNLSEEFDWDEFLLLQDELLFAQL